MSDKIIMRWMRGGKNSNRSLTKDMIFGAKMQYARAVPSNNIRAIRTSELFSPADVYFDPTSSATFFSHHRDDVFLFIYSFTYFFYYMVLSSITTYQRYLLKRACQFFRIFSTMQKGIFFMEYSRMSNK